MVTFFFATFFLATFFFAAFFFATFFFATFFLATFFFAVFFLVTFLAAFFFAGWAASSAGAGAFFSATATGLVRTCFVACGPIGFAATASTFTAAALGGATIFLRLLFGGSSATGTEATGTTA